MNIIDEQKREENPSYLEINNFELGKYTINIKLDNNTSYGVYSRMKQYISRFLFSITGIPKVKGTCLHQNKDIFDNEIYFKNRLYLDFSDSHMKTLNSTYISNALENRYGITFNITKFKEAIAQTNIRSEVLITDEYKFTNLGKTLSGYCLLKGLSYPNIIIDNPLKYCRNTKVKDIIIKYITNKTVFNSMIIGTYSLHEFMNDIDKFIILTDNKDAVIVDPKNDTFLVADDNINLRNRLFYFDSMVICKNDYTKEELRMFVKRRQKYKIIKFIDVVNLVEAKK